MKNNFDNEYCDMKFASRQNHPGDILKDEIIVKMVQKFGDAKIKILDMGCGMGHTSLLLSNISDRRVGIDSSIEDIKIAKYMIKNDVMVADCTMLPFRDACFNVIVMKDVLVYINDDIKCMKEINRILQDNALLILYVPYSLCDSISFESIVKKVFGYSIDKDIGFVKRYDIIELKDKLHNFEIIKSFYFAHFLFGIISLFSVFLRETNKLNIKKVNGKADTKKVNGKVSINKNLSNLIKLLGKIEFSLLSSIKGPGVFIIARKKII